MDLNKDYYKELGVDKNASDEDIKKGFRNLAIKHHPDKSKDDGKLFQSINEAYQVLSDPNTRQEYDIRSAHGKNYSPFQSPFEFSFNRGGSQRGGFGGFDPFEIFNEMFSNGYRGHANFHQREEFNENLNIHAEFGVTLKDIYADKPITLQYKKQVKCSSCNGTGFDNDSDLIECEVCDSKGKDAYGYRCESCQGKGKISTKICNQCKGVKVEMKDSTVTINNVFSIRRNSRNEHGGYGHQSKHYMDHVGNLVLDIKILPNDRFEVRDSDLYANIDVHFQDAIDGNDILFNHIDDSQLKVKLPKKAKNGEFARVKEKGFIKNSQKERGDLYLKINIIIDYDKLS